jgi:NADP-dependent 3-hydroxy acid dehydrogenase YdfG
MEAVVTGSSSGIGFKTCLLLAKNPFFAFKLMEIRKNKSDKEFRKLVMKGVLK